MMEDIAKKLHARPIRTIRGCNRSWIYEDVVNRKTPVDPYWLRSVCINCIIVLKGKAFFETKKHKVW